MLFVAPDLDVKMQSADTRSPARAFSETITRGDMTVETFKEVMDKRWRYREENEAMADGYAASQDSGIERLIWA